MKDMDYIIIDCLKGKKGNISVMFLGAPFRLENEKTKRYIDPNFGAWLLEEIYNQNNLFCIRKGFFHKEWFCPSCKTMLKISNIIQNQYKITLAYKDYPSFMLQCLVVNIL